MVASHSFAEFLSEQLAPLGRVTMRRMFGKTGVFCDGVMLGMVTENTLYFRVDDDNRVTFKEAESFPPLNYEKKGSTIDQRSGALPTLEVRHAECFRCSSWAYSSLVSPSYFSSLSKPRKGRCAGRPDCHIGEGFSFWRVPERLFDEPDELVAWARAALAAARRVAAKRERTAPKRKSKPQPT